MARLLTMVGVVLALVGGCVRQASMPEPSAAPGEAISGPQLECELFRRTVQGRCDGTSALALMRRGPDSTESISPCRIEQPCAGPEENAAFLIDVSYTGSRHGADLYRVNYRLTVGERESSREFEVRYVGDPVTAIDDEYGRLVFRPPAP